MKKVNKTLTGGLAAVMASGMVPMTAMAATNFDELHKAAYNAVKVAQETKTQADINAARKVVAEYRSAIEAEGKDGLLVNINTFSELLDGVQQPILTDIVNKIIAMKEAKKATQAEINAVRVLVDNLPTSLQNAVNTWSSEVDTFQAALIEAATTAVKTAETEKTQEAVDAAKVLVEELATSVRPGIQKVAANLQARLDAVIVVEYDFEVETAEVTKTGVNVTFKALTEDIEEATLVVMNNKDEVVEVKIQALAKGETVATFVFEKSLTSRPTGTWTVNGVKVNLDESNLVKDALAASNADKLFVVLEKSGLVENLVDSLKTQEAYFTLLNERNVKGEIKTLDDIQKVVDDANSNSDAESQVEAVVKAAFGTLSTFTKEFNKLELDQVNSDEDWIIAYRNKIKSEETGMNGYNPENKNSKVVSTLSDIKAAIKTVNNKAVNEEIQVSKLLSDEVLSLNKISSAIKLVEDYYVVDTNNKEEVKAKEDKIKELNEYAALAKVATASTVSSLRDALTNLTEVFGKDKFDSEKKVNVDILSDVLKERNAKAIRNIDSVNIMLAEGFLKAESNAIKAIEEAAKVIVNKVIVDKVDEEKVTVTEKTKFFNALKNLEKVSAKQSDSNKFEYKNVKENLFMHYALVLEKNVDSTETVSRLVKEQNNSIIKNVLSNLTSEDQIAEVIKKLSDAKLGLTGINKDNAAEYIADYAILQNADTVANLQKVVNALNAKASLRNIDKNTSLNTIKSNIVEYAKNRLFMEAKLVYITQLSDAQLLDLSEEFRDIFANKDNFPEDILMLDMELAQSGYSNSSRTSKLTKINEAKKVVADLEVDLALYSTDFKNLTSAAKTTVATLIANKVANTNNHVYKNYTEIRNDINWAIGQL